MRARFAGSGRGCCSPRTDFARNAAPVVPADGVVEVQEWQDEAEDGQVLRIHDEGACVQDECEEEFAEHRSAPPAVGASHGVAAEADAAAAASCTAGADAATAACSRSAGSTEVVRVPKRRSSPNC